MTLKRILLLIGLIGCVSGAQAAVTNLYHTNRVFRPITFNINGTPSAYEVYSMVGRLTTVVGPTNIIVNTNNTFATEYEAMAWGYPSATGAWAAVSTNYVNYTNNYPAATYDNVGWVKGTHQAYGDWGAFLWLMQNQVGFKTSDTNVWISPNGKTNFIVKVLVGSIGDYAPMANVVDRGPTNWAMITNYPGTESSTDVVCRGDYTAYYELLLLGMTAYRPTTEGPQYGYPIRMHDVPENLEEAPGAGIRVNGDDDNNNSMEDRNDTTVADENDLVEVILRATPNPLGLKYVLKRNNSNIKVWSSQTKGTAILDVNNETNLVFDTPVKVVWVENPNGGTSDLEFEARTVPGDVLVGSDKIHFYPFSSVVVFFEGEFGVPSDPPASGISALALSVYMNGYDIHIYDEPDIGESPNAEDVAFTEIDSAVENRGVTAVAVIGYSHGGGSTFRISDRMAADQTAFNLVFTAYIDAITQPLLNATAENRRPVGSSFHANYYQVAQMNDSPLFLDGTPSTPPGAGFEDNVDDPTVTEGHTTIDDAQIVHDGIRTRLFQQVNR
ncbi:MAG: hypothetical protein A2X46_17320 [Lentisphaerae bacterium GWF2_57_35]|nr:MAG: hypothetical protein A2X46_17320 [Lentisphaerae bacterium GWF2_57_35]